VRRCPKDIRSTPTSGRFFVGRSGASNRDPARTIPLMDRPTGQSGRLGGSAAATPADAIDQLLKTAPVDGESGEEKKQLDAVMR